MENLLNQIESWASSNNIRIFNGFNISRKGANIIVCRDENPDEFLEIALTNNISHIVLDIDYFEFEDMIDSILEKNSRRIDNVEEEVLESFRARLESFNKYDGNIFHITIEWQKEGFSYLFDQFADFYVEFMDEIEALKTEQEENKLASQPPQLPQKEYDLLIETIASSDKYFKNHTQPGAKLDYVIEDIIEKEAGINKDNYQINMYKLKLDVEKFFNKKCYQGKAQEYSEEIKEMKRQGMTKKAIIAKLGITEGMFDKLAHL